MRILLAAVFMFSALPSKGADALGQNACEREMARAAEQQGIPLGVLYAVGLAETGRGDSLRPYALNIAGRAVYDIDRAQALTLLENARRAGIRSIDIGCMQINRLYHADHFDSVDDMLDPAKNVAYAARFLKDLHTREGSWTMAVARYHAGPGNDPAQKRYVCRVITNMVATGFGDWTEDARAFCRPQ